MKFVLLLIIGTFMTACGQEAFNAKNLEENISSKGSELTELSKKVEAQSKELDLLLYEVENDPTIQEIRDNANPSLIDLGGIKDLIKDGLKPIFGKIGDFRQKLEDLKNKLENQLGLLDPNNPDHKEMIERLKDMILKIEGFQDRINDMIDQLKDKLSSLDAIFDRLLDRLDGSKFWHIPARMIIEEIQDMLMDKIDELIGLLPSQP